MRASLENAAVRLDGVLIFTGIDLDILGPGVTAIMGPSGVGKTTLLRAIAGFVPLSGGQKTLRSQNRTGFSGAALAALAERAGQCRLRPACRGPFARRGTG